MGVGCRAFGKPVNDQGVWVAEARDNNLVAQAVEFLI